MAGFTKKAIQVELSLVDSKFSNGSGDKTVDGLATSVSISKAGLPALNQCVVEIFNMKQEDVNTITTTSHINLKLNRNRITVKAGVAGQALSVVFKGEIVWAYGIYPSPDIGVHIEAMGGIYPALTVDRPFTFDGQISGKSMLRQFTEKMGYNFQDNGAKDRLLTDPAVNGSPLEKIQQVAKAMDLQAICDDEQIIISPWSKGLGGIIEVGKETGMIAYPQFNPSGIQVRHEYNPNFRQGGLIRVKSIVPRANGAWKIIKLEHQLQAFGAGPGWDTTIDGIYANG